MLIQQKTKPNNVETAKNFNHDAPLLAGFVTLGALCQFWSGFSEFIGLNGYMIDLAGLYLSPTLAYWIGNGIALGMALTIEVATFALITYVVNSFFNGYLAFTFNFSKEQRSNWLKFLIAFGVLVFVVVLSATVSKRNVAYQTKAAPPTVEVEEINPLLIESEQNINRIEKRFKEDSQRLMEQLSNQMTLDKKGFKTQRKGLNLELKSIQGKETKTGKSYATQKQIIEKKLVDLELEEAQTLATLQRTHNAQMMQLADHRNASLSSINQNLQQDKNRIQQRNENLLDAHEKRNNWLSYFLAAYAQYAVFIFLFTRIWVCISYNTCGIKPKVYVKPEYFESSILRDLWILVSTYPTRCMHNYIRMGMSKIPELKTIPKTGALMDVQQFASVTANANANAVHAPNIENNRIDDLSSMNKRDGSTIVEKVVYVNAQPTKICPNCDTEFTYKNKKKTYCSDACRMESWEKKNGKVLKRGKGK